METLGEYLKSLRGTESLRDASKRIGISHTYLDTVEKGYDKRSGKPVKPTPETLKLFANAYNQNYEELMVRAGYLEDPSIISPVVLYGHSLTKLRYRLGLSFLEVSRKTGINIEDLEKYEKGEVPTREHEIALQKFFNSVQDSKKKEEKDIAKRMAELRADIENAEGLAFDGEPMSEEAKESLLEAMEFAVRTAKKINKKYTPKKYRQEE